MSDFSRGHSERSFSEPVLWSFLGGACVIRNTGKAGDNCGDMCTAALNFFWYNIRMGEIMRDTFKQVLPIFAAAGIAAAFAFGQSLAHSAGFCPAPTASVEEVGFLGGAVKMVHSIWRARFG